MFRVFRKKRRDKKQDDKIKEISRLVTPEVKSVVYVQNFTAATGSGAIDRISCTLIAQGVNGAERIADQVRVHAIEFHMWFNNSSSVDNGLVKIFVLRDNGMAGAYLTDAGILNDTSSTAAAMLGGWNDLNVDPRPRLKSRMLNKALKKRVKIIYDPPQITLQPSNLATGVLTTSNLRTKKVTLRFKNPLMVNFIGTGSATANQGAGHIFFGWQANTVNALLGIGIKTYFTDV